MRPEELRAAFEMQYRYPCRLLARAPGRINLIGEHTDYNEGFVLPVATPLATWAAIGLGRGSEQNVRACSVNLGSCESWPAGRWRDRPRAFWTAYVAGVAELLERGGAWSGGFDLLVASELPIGGGLSSSAALCVAVATGLLALTGKNWPIDQVAALCRAAEHEYAGVPCGVMDQYASLACRADHALLLDCRSLEYQHVPVNLPDFVFVVVDSGVRHELAASEYARRQKECTAAVEVLRRYRPELRTLRDASETEVQAVAARMPGRSASRARHVTSENRRVLAAVDALRTGDALGFGTLMCESHRSLRDDYEVSCPEIDRLVELLMSVPGVLGARLSGGGFGGCVVALVNRQVIGPVAQALAAASDRQMSHHVVRPAAGAAVEVG